MAIGQGKQNSLRNSQAFSSNMKTKSLSKSDTANLPEENIQSNRRSFKTKGFPFVSVNSRLFKSVISSTKTAMA